MANQIVFKSYRLTAAEEGGFYVERHSFHTTGMAGDVVFAGSLDEALDYLKSKLSAPTD